MSESRNNSSGGGIGCLSLIIIGALIGWAFFDMSPKAAVVLGLKIAAGWFGLIFGLVCLILLVIFGAWVLDKRDALRRAALRKKWDGVK